MNYDYVVFDLFQSFKVFSERHTSTTNQEQVTVSEYLSTQGNSHVGTTLQF